MSGRTYEDITFTADDSGVAVLTLQRPEVRNAFRFQTFAEIEDAVLGLDRSVRALVVTGADPAFCSGDDVRAIMGGGEQVERRRHVPALTPASDAFLFTNIPVIAAVNGAAVGWGMELVLMADLRVASERARFGELFVKRGLVSDPAGLARLAQLVGREKATELLLTGDLIDAVEAQRIGLVGRVVPHEQLLDESLRWPAASPPTLLSQCRRSRKVCAAPLILIGPHSGAG